MFYLILYYAKFIGNRCVGKKRDNVDGFQKFGAKSVMILQKFGEKSVIVLQKFVVFFVITCHTVFT